MTPASYYHLSKSAIGRAQGRSAVAAAAYRTATCIENEREGTVADYSRKRGVVASWTTAPEGSPDWAFDTAKLWNAAEAKETRKNSQLAHELTLALPASLDDAGRQSIMEKFAGELRDRYGCAVTVAIHRPSAAGDDRNDHAHVMLTTRTVGPDGWGGKIRELNSLPQVSAEVAHIRELAADLINSALEDAGSDERVDYRSFKERGITDRAPTTHLGPSSTALEREGAGSDRGDTNREIIAERIAEQEKLLDALARQFDGTPPGGGLTLETERELARRFGDEWTEDRRATDGAVALDGGNTGGQQWSEERREGGGTPEGMQAELYRLEMTGTTQARPSLWARVRASADAFLDYARDVREMLAGWLEKLRGDAERSPDAGGVAGAEIDPAGFAGRVEAERGGGEPLAGDTPRPGGAVDAPAPGPRPQPSLSDPFLSAWAEPWPEDEGVTPVEPDTPPEPGGPDRDDGPDMG